MKNILTIVILASATLIASAQINLENTYYASNLGLGNLTVVKLSISGYKYLYRSVDTNELRLYNLNHTLWKTIYLPKPNSASISLPIYVSEELFNLDSKVEAIYTYNKSGSNPYKYRTTIVNEDGVVIKYFDEGQGYAIYSTGSNGWKLVIDVYNQSYSNVKREVYSLPGTGVALEVNDNPAEFSVGNLGSAFPNPSNEQISLPYNIPNGKNTATITVLNINGVVINTYKVDNIFNSLHLDISDYQSGTYLYTLSVDNIIVNTKKFIKK